MIDIKSLKQKEIYDPEPELPDDLSLSSNGSDSLKLSIFPDIPLTSYNQSKKPPTFSVYTQTPQEFPASSLLRQLIPTENENISSSVNPKKKKTVKKVIRRLIRKEPSKTRLLEKLFKAREEKEELERSIATERK